MVVAKIFCLIFFLVSPDSDLKEIRSMFMQAPFDKTKTHQLIHKLEQIEEYNITLQGYKGSTTIILAKHAINPYMKIKYFNCGKGILEAAIKLDKNNAELRFLRYAIQNKIPSILGYNKNVTEDQAFLNSHVNEIKDDQLKQMIQLSLK